MIAESTVSSKYQTTLPKALVKKLGIKPSSQIIYQCEGPYVIMRAKTLSFKDAVARFPRKGQKAASLEEMQEAIEQGREPW